jgi:hypothetical protein
MYTRNLLPQRDSPVEGGKPLQGTWTTPFKTVDLMSIERPYQIPLPRRITVMRLKEWQMFTAQNGDVWMEAVIANLKFFCFAEIVFWDKSSGEKMHVFKILPFSPWKLPRTLEDSVVEHDGADFSFRIHDAAGSRTVTLDMNIASAIERPVFTAHLEFELDIQKTTPLTTNMIIAGNRSMYIFKCFSGIEGSITWGGRAIALHSGSAFGLFQDCKGFIPYRARYFTCRAFGFDVKGRRFGFSLGEHITKKLNVNNENALWLEAVLTALPPVRITEYERGEAVIQDLEGMVDLSFKRADETVFSFDMLFMGMEHRMPMGQFNGMMVATDGEKIPVRNMPGIVEYFNFRL